MAKDTSCVYKYFLIFLWITFIVIMLASYYYIFFKYIHLKNLAAASSSTAQRAQVTRVAQPSQVTYQSANASSNDYLASPVCNMLYHQRTRTQIHAHIQAQAYGARKSLVWHSPVRQSANASSNDYSYHFAVVINSIATGTTHTSIGCILREEGRGGRA